MPSLSKIVFKLLRAASYLIVSMLGLFVILSLVLVFYVSPRLEQWREPIQNYIHSHTGMAITFGELDLSWRGVNPRLVLKDTHFHAIELSDRAQSQPRASFGEVQFYLTPKLTFWKGGLLHIEVQNSTLPVLIDAEGDVWVGQHHLPMSGVTFSQLPENDNQTDIEGASFIAALSSYLTQDYTEQVKLLLEDKYFKWLSSISVENLKLSIRDASELATAVPLDETGDELKIVSPQPSSQVYDFVLNVKNATLTAEKQRIKSDILLQSDMVSGQDIVIDNLIDYSQFDENKNHQVTGYLSIRSGDLEPKQLFANVLEQLNIHTVIVKHFHFDAHLKDGFWENFKAELQLDNFSMPQARFAEMRVNVEGEVADAMALFVGHGHQHMPIRFQTSMSDGWLYETNNFRHEFALADVKVNGSYELDDANLPVLSFNELLVNDPNVRLNALGNWHGATQGSGYIRLEGEIDHLVASYLPRFLPKAIGADVLDWLDGAFVSGELYNGHFLVDGLVDDYPFGLNPESGVNKIVAEFRDFGLDFDHQAQNIKWPILHMEQGTYRFINDDMLIDANRGWMNNLADEKSIDFDNLKATINGLQEGTKLQIESIAETTADQFLVLMKQTPLSALLSGALDDSIATGDLRASLVIGIPLRDMNSSTVTGKVHVTDGTFKLNPSFPQSTEVNGSLSFNEQYLSIDDLNVQLLGGPAHVHGNVGRTGDVLKIKGRLSGTGIHDYYSLKGLRQLKGLTPYELNFVFEGDHEFKASLTSHLQGLSIQYPGLYTKAAQSTVPLHVQWQRKSGGAARFTDHISADYDNGALQFASDFYTDRAQAFNFKRGAFALGEKPVAPDSGLFFHGAVNAIEIESLTHWIANFGFGESGGSSEQIVNGFDVRAKEVLIGGMSLLDVRAKSRLKDLKTIALELSGPTIQGDLTLKESNKAKGAYDVKADLKHFHWQIDKGSDNDESKNIVKSETESPWKINHLDLKVQDLHIDKYHFHNVGASGEAEDKQNWRLDKLTTQDDYGHLFGAGYVRNKNDKILADLNFNINALNIEGLLEALDLGENVLSGQADIQGGIVLNDLLNFKRDDIELNALGVLRDGHINNVGNTATKILALLSIQALGKLPEWNKIFAGKGQNAINYDYMRFHYGLKGGQFWLPDFRLSSPLIALVAQGEGNLKKETINLDVVAIPSLDMSGAAVLTGVLVNPAVGVAAFLSQWLLKSPMEKALTQRFKVDGTFDDIRIDGVPLDENKLKEAKELDSKNADESQSGSVQQEEESKPSEKIINTVIEAPEEMIDLIDEESLNPHVPILLE